MTFYGASISCWARFTTPLQVPTGSKSFLTAGVTQPISKRICASSFLFWRQLFGLHRLNRFARLNQSPNVSRENSQCSSLHADSRRHLEGRLLSRFRSSLFARRA